MADGLEMAANFRWNGSISASRTSRRTRTTSTDGAQRIDGVLEGEAPELEGGQHWLGQQTAVPVQSASTAWLTSALDGITASSSMANSVTHRFTTTPH